MNVDQVIEAPRSRGLKFNTSLAENAISVLSPILLLLLWEICARAGLVDTRFFPAPSSIVSALIQTTMSGGLLHNTWISLQRLFWGFLFGAVPALILGITMGLSPLTRAIFDPLIIATYPIPKSSILPLA